MCINRRTAACQMSAVGRHCCACLRLTWKDDEVSGSERVSGRVGAETDIQSSVVVGRSTYCQLVDVTAVLATQRRRVDTSQVAASDDDKLVTVEHNQRRAVDDVLRRLVVFVHSLQPLHRQTTSTSVPGGRDSTNFRREWCCHLASTTGSVFV